MQNQNFTDTIQNIASLINQLKFDEANMLLETIKENPNKEIILTLNGLMELRKKNYENSINFFISAIEKNPNYLLAYTNLASAYEKLNNFINAEKYLNESIKLNPKSDLLQNALGLMIYKQDKIKESMSYFQKAIEINPLNANAYFNIGNANFSLKNFLPAKENFLSTLQINKNYPDAFFNLAECEKKLKNFENALFYYKIALQEKLTWLRKDKITAKILESYLILNKKEEYASEMSLLIKNDTDNRRIAATSAFISSQFKIEDEYPFCPKPLDFIYKTSLKSYFKNYDQFLNQIFEEVTKEKFQWEPSGKTTRKGMGTQGNLSENKLKMMKVFEDAVLKELQNYFTFYSKEKITFIKNWPSKFKIISWSNRLKKQGYNITHIHPGGWVSGVMYLKMPKDIKNDEAGIEFSLHGDDYHIVDKNIPTKLYTPTVGDLLFFPSSLFHRTIPFESNEERVVIAFDLCSYNNK